MTRKLRAIIVLTGVPLLAVMLLLGKMGGVTSALEVAHDGQSSTAASGLSAQVDDAWPQEELADFYTVTVNIVGSGSVTKDPEQTTYETGTVVELRAVPDTGYRFEGWSGDLTGSTSPVDLTVTNNHIITATFKRACYTLNLAKSGTGAIPVATPEKSEQCTTPGQFVAGQVIQLQAAPATHWTVTGWVGTANDGSTATTNSVTMPASSHTVTVNYAPICYALNTAVLPPATGSIARVPATDPICPAGQYLEDAEVQLTANAATGYEFANWSGGATGNTNPTTVIMSGVRNVTANFRLACYALSLNKTGSGNLPGASPEKSAQCTNASDYVMGQNIQLEADPAPNWLVKSWEGTNNDNSTSTSNSLTMPAVAHVVTVNYIEKPTLQFSAASYSVNEDGANASILVVRTGSLKETVSVNYSTADGTAEAGQDYQSVNSTLTFGANVSEKTITIPILDDLISEGSETLSVALSAPSGNAKLGSPVAAQLTILDDEGEPTVQLGNTTFVTSEISPTATVSVTLFPASVESVFVEFTTADGTATAGEDYLDASRTLRFWPGQTTKQINVTILDDPLDENDETVELSLSEAVNAVLGDAAGTLTIVDNDAPPTVQFSAAEYFAKEGTPIAPVSVTLSVPSALAVTTQYEVTQVTVGLQLVGSVTFEPGEVAREIAVPIGDKTAGDELNLLLKSAENATLAPPSSARLIILDKDRSECHDLKLNFTGYGAAPLATNLDHSIGCADGQYVANELINILAAPDSGWHVDGWYGTLNDDSHAEENVVRMPDGDHAVTVYYMTSTFLANVSNNYVNYFEGPQEAEPNGSFSAANGPIRSGKVYVGGFSSLTDADDLYSFVMPKAGPVEIRLTDVPQGTDYNLYLYNVNRGQGLMNFSGAPDNDDEYISVTIQPGLYYVRVANDRPDKRIQSTEQYRLQVNYE